jgi:hypothetical protein
LAQGNSLRAKSGNTFKRGNIGRKDWNANENSIRQSLEDIADTYIGYDSLLADPVKLHALGVGQELRDVPAEPDELLQRLAKPGPEVPPIDEASWYKTSQAYLPLLAARHWRLQVPCEMLVKHAMAVSGKTLSNEMTAGM